jgi:hypothetical protein
MSAERLGATVREAEHSLRALLFNANTLETPVSTQTYWKPTESHHNCFESVITRQISGLAISMLKQHIGKSVDERQCEPQKSRANNKLTQFPIY